MLRVTVELVPGGVGEPVMLGELRIANDIVRSFETGGKRGDYKYVIRGKVGRLLRSGMVENYPRLSKPVWCLILRCLTDAGYK